MNNSKGDIEKLEGTVESTIETLRQIGIIIEDFKDESQEQLFKKISEFEGLLIDMDKMRNSFDSVEVPIEALLYIDEGKNPELYTKDSLEHVYRAKLHEDGKSESLSFYKQLIETQLFPSPSDAAIASNDIMEIEEKLFNNPSQP